MFYNELGYDSYDDYLYGPEWREIRQIFYKLKVPYRCRLCHKRKNLLVHKRSYYTLRVEDFRKMNRGTITKILVYLCIRCNRWVHYYNKAERVPLDHLWLWEREFGLFWRPDMQIRRLFRDLWALIKWVVYSYRLGTNKPRRSL